MNRDKLSQISFFIVSARSDVLQAARDSDRLGLTTAHMRLMFSADALDDALEAIGQADAAAELLERL